MIDDLFKVRLGVFMRIQHEFIAIQNARLLSWKLWSKTLKAGSLKKIYFLKFYQKWPAPIAQSLKQYTSDHKLSDSNTAASGTGQKQQNV